MLKINIITAQPGIFESPLKERPFKAALENEGAQIKVINLRNFALDSYGTIDGKPFGGGVGMVLRVEPIFKALLSIYNSIDEINLARESSKIRIVALDPSGVTWNQQKAKEYSNLEEITFICGRYEGIDQRVFELFTSELVSIGDFVTSGGELPTLTILESILRLDKSVLAKPEATELESFSTLGHLEHPQYTRPEEFMGSKVPEVLLSGDHKKIENWRNTNSKLFRS